MMRHINRLNDFFKSIMNGNGDPIMTGSVRLKIVTNIVILCFILVVIRVGDLTLLQGHYNDPTGPQANIKTQEKLMSRADIVDRNGVLLATTLQSQSLYADPTLLDNKPYLAHQLAEILDIENPLDRLNKQSRFVWIKRGVTPDQQKQINDLGTPGLAFKTEPKRFYPHGNLLSHLVGYTSIDGEGLAGIELKYNDRLDNQNNPLQLNIDVRVQYALTKALKNKQNAFSAKAAMGGIVDIRTGEVIAAASIPDFDPHAANIANNNQRFNRFASGVYEMGSTFKLFSTASYIEETGHPFSKTFDAREPLKEGRFTINDFHAEKRILTLPEVFIHSSNIGSALMGRAIGNDNLQKFYTDLGLMNQIKTDFPAIGKPLTPKTWRDVNTLTASYGHGIAVTPLHVLQATAIIANGGIQTGLSFAKETPNNNKILTRIISPSTAYKMQQLLRLNVLHGSGAKADVAGYMVGGKTGTSEKVTAQGYSKDKLLSSFIGVFPIDQPRYAILAILDEPQGTKDSYGYATGGWTAAPVVGDVVADMVRILGLPASGNDNNMVAGLDRYLNTKPAISPASF